MKLKQIGYHAETEIATGSLLTDQVKNIAEFRYHCITVDYSWHLSKDLLIITSSVMTLFRSRKRNRHPKHTIGEITKTHTGSA